ncbi:MAG TPA: hypothetical protein VL832_20960 [Puia sp.]|nr:hypothetical protein [Puia sp.]
MTTRHISYNPRVLKEADALHAHGYEVSVVTINNHQAQWKFDEDLMRSRKWKLETVNFRRGREHTYWLYLSLKQKLFSWLSRITCRFGIAERSINKAYDGLTRLAKKTRADFYLVHHVEALGAGFAAARRHKAAFGFDAEDFHSGMSEFAVPSPSDDIIVYLESKYLPHCNYMTAASKGIATAYHEKYGVPTPRVLLNVFPWEDLPAREVKEPVRFYWYSQVIGPNRGLELLLEAAGKIGLPGPAFEIHLRGSLYSDEYRDSLKAMANKGGIGNRLFFHEPILAEDIVHDGNNFDVGMALESPVSVNRNICVTNKVFSYLMSRLLIIGTDTEGQKDIFSHFPDAVSICRVNDADEIAKAMLFYINDKDQLKKAKMAAGAAVQNPFNWEWESKKLLHYISDIS